MPLGCLGAERLAVPPGGGRLPPPSPPTRPARKDVPLPGAGEGPGAHPRPSCPPSPGSAAPAPQPGSRGQGWGMAPAPEWGCPCPWGAMRRLPASEPALASFPLRRLRHARLPQPVRCPRQPSLPLDPAEVTRLGVPARGLQEPQWQPALLPIPLTVRGRARPAQGAQGSLGPPPFPAPSPDPGDPTLGRPAETLAESPALPGCAVGSGRWC